MFILFIIGLFCLLLVIGAFTEDGPLVFAVRYTVLIVALAFVVFIAMLVYGFGSQLIG